MSRRVEIRIERLVLHGLPDATARATADGLRVELERRLARPGALDQLIGTAGARVVNAGAFSVGTRDDPRSVGTQAGRRIAKRLT
jgi:hypothetical protein